MPFKHYALIAILLATPVHARWVPETYSQEHNDCVKACDKNNPSDHGKCVSYCDCAIGDMQAQFPDHGQMVREVTQQKLPSRVATLQTIANACNQKVFGKPAKKLEIK